MFATAVRGRQIAESGDLRRLRERLGLTRTAMSVLLNVSAMTYSQWEKPPGEARRRMWTSTAEKIARFYDAATVQLNEMQDAGVDLARLIPFHLAATLLGIPQELLFQRYRDGVVTGVDLGILGLWMERDHLQSLGAR
jgi:transcriptional regulator with XRE-family HTH domain